MLAETFGVRIDWLKSGEEPMRDVPQSGMDTESAEAGYVMHDVTKLRPGDTQVIYKIYRNEDGTSFYVKTISMRITVKQAHREMRAAGIPTPEDEESANKGPIED